MSKNSNLLKFKPAKLCQGKDWFISYYVINPASEKLERKRIKLNFIEKIPDRKKYADALMKEINAKLYSGWNPFEEDMNPRGFKKLTDILNIFYQSKARELREDSLRSYRSYIKILTEYLIKHKKENITCENFKKIDALEFLSYTYINRKLSSYTYNNYKSFYSSLWNWLKENEYVTQNHFDKISKKTTQEKERILIPVDVREKIKNHLEKTDYDFMIVSLLVFHTLLRPKEIAHMKPMNFDLKNGVIHIPSSAAKNKHERLATIPNILINYLENWDFNKANPNQFIFSDNFLPGNKPMNARYFSKNGKNFGII